MKIIECMIKNLNEKRLWSKNNIKDEFKTQ